jgi:SAM-dependent methyltransferase
VEAGCALKRYPSSRLYPFNPWYLWLNISGMRACVDEPVVGKAVDPLCFLVRGWIAPALGFAAGDSVEAWSGSGRLGGTAVLHERPDVTAALGLARGTLTGFEFFAHHPEAGGKPFDMEIRLRRNDGTEPGSIAILQVTPIARDYRTNHFGVLLDRRTTAIQRRANIWAVGPSQHEGSGELAALLRRHLGSPPQRLIDVGCGFGSYGRGLLADGYDWLGVEVNPADCAELSRLGLPHRQVDGRTLPFADGAFDAALCVEVLEHIEDPAAFLREVARVAPRKLIVSVPNCELLGYLWDHLATPWHMLEASHVNFFTRWSLGELLRGFYPEVELGFHTPYPLRTIEGTPLHYNLLAVATRPA